tara:strand:- start:7507 stop:7611 length:105 start_codon:yes stop_codon:yes gene_type:complete
MIALKRFAFALFTGLSMGALICAALFLPFLIEAT